MLDNGQSKMSRTASTDSTNSDKEVRIDDIVIKPPPRCGQCNVVLTGEYYDNEGKLQCKNCYESAYRYFFFAKYYSAITVINIIYLVVTNVTSLLLENTLFLKMDKSYIFNVSTHIKYVDKLLSW